MNQLPGTSDPVLIFPEWAKRQTDETLLLHEIGRRVRSGLDEGGEASLSPDERKALAVFDEQQVACRTSAQYVYENLPPEAVAVAASFIRGLFYNQGDGPLDEAQAAKNLTSYVLYAVGWRP